MKSILKTIGIPLLLIAVGVVISIWFSKPSGVVSSEIITKRDTIYVYVTDSVPYAIIDTVRVKSEPVVIRIPSNTPIYLDTISFRDVPTTRYTGQEVLSNGTIDYTIYADSLQATAFKLTTKDKTITNTITEKITLPPISRLYLSGGLNSTVNDININSASIGLMYNRRQKWGVGLELTQDLTGLLPASQQTSIGSRVYIGL